jgi:hypothetical protein
MQIERVSADVRPSTSGQPGFERQGAGWQRVGRVSLVEDGHSVMRATAPCGMQINSGGMCGRQSMCRSRAHLRTFAITASISAVGRLQRGWLGAV